jgi:hypothetical protein
VDHAWLELTRPAALLVKTVDYTDSRLRDRLLAVSVMLGNSRKLQMHQHVKYALWGKHQILGLIVLIARKERTQTKLVSKHASHVTLVWILQFLVQSMRVSALYVSKATLASHLTFRAKCVPNLGDNSLLVIIVSHILSFEQEVFELLRPLHLFVFPQKLASKLVLVESHLVLLDMRAFIAVLVVLNFTD